MNEFPESIAETQKLIDQLDEQVAKESDREQRRELFLLLLELKEHLSLLKNNQDKAKV